MDMIQPVCEEPKIIYLGIVIFTLTCPMAA